MINTWDEFLRLQRLDLEQLIEDKKFSTNKARVTNRKELLDLLKKM